MHARPPVWLAVIALVAAVCGGSADEPTTTTAPPLVTTTAAPTTTSSAPVSTAGQRADCVGFYLGTFGGDNAGPYALSITDDGSLASAFVRPDSLDVDLSDVGSLGDILDEVGLVLGEDITVGLTGVQISPSALEVSADGVRLGILEVRLASEGSVDENGSISGTEKVSGSFAWDTCAGSGTWNDDGDTGTWQVALAAAGLTVDVEACDEGIFVGVKSDFGDIDIDLDAFCLSQSVRDLPPKPGTDDIEIKGNEDVSVYTLNATVLFEFGSNALTADATSTLDEAAAAILSEAVDGAMVTVIGHTDSIGPSEFNFDLSARRAEAVRAALAERLTDATIEAFGLGESSPIASNGNPDGTDNPDGRRQNRRVEIIVTG